MFIIGIHGKARAGKDTLGKAVVAQSGALRTALADPLKLGVAHAFGFSEDVVFSDEFKSTYYPRWGLTGRQILEKFGTESMRDVFGPQVWLKSVWPTWQFQLERVGSAVVTDVRFENEAYFIRSIGGLIVHVRRPGLKEDHATPGHRSNLGIVQMPEDAVVVNDSTIEMLQRQAAGVIAKAELAFSKLEVPIEDAAAQAFEDLDALGEPEAPRGS